MAGVSQELGTLLGALRYSVLKRDGSIALGSSAPKLPTDGYVALVFVVGLFAFNWAFRLLVVQPVARVLLGAGSSERVLAGRVAKFSQAAMEAVFYGSFTLVGAAIVPAQPWIWPSKHWWIGFSTGEHSIMRDDLRCYYLLYGARYAQGTLTVLLEPKRKDFVEMVLHHLVTVAVVAISYLYGWNRVGAVVMLLLDPGDVPLHTAKMFKYVSEARHRNKLLAATCAFVADRVFELFALLFFVTRVAMYPYVCWSAHVEATRYFPKGLPEWTCVALLETLFALQCYWFFLILKVALVFIRTGHAEDVRSDDEDDPHTPDDRHKED
eukprot:CAMPEP_0197400150 /NCGR_PEP_ID=MMETSP1165-20131217/16410_1 /TAXON_ID=284809 /ORGANISM="Chrysocystis fragilis, Strain CCMP3189" /LENGTH=323 /DNA_ID=CAMNT_0042926197 /DNA_START=18 /DNA_END=989 /DNA_ORIENTATION=+